MNVTAASRGKGAPLTPAEERRIFSGHPWYTLVDLSSRLEGGLLGLLTGDDEFHSPEALPRLDYIQLDPPQGFRRAHRRVPRGVWSDDGAQALCLLESLLNQGRLDPDDLAARLVRWHRDGHMAVQSHLLAFDVTASSAIRCTTKGCRACPPSSVCLDRPAPGSSWGPAVYTSIAVTSASPRNP